MLKRQFFGVCAIVLALTGACGSVVWAGLPSDVAKALDAYEAGQNLARRDVSQPVQRPRPVVQKAVVAPGERRRHETEVGLETYVYRYEETVGGEHFMDLEGQFYGLFINHTFRPNQLDPLWGDLMDTFRFEARYAWARVDYDGGVQDNEGNAVAPFTMSDVPDFVVEGRVLVGKEMFLGNSCLMPYAGFGMRFLHDDSSDTYGTFDYEGDTYTLNGYKRTSEYYYLPFGADWKFRFGTWSVGMNGELDVFLYGHQKSFLESTSGAVPKDQQNEGFGLRTSVRLEKMANPVGFLIEPFFRYWNLEDSEKTDGYEPSNETHELGLKMGLIF